MPLEQHLPMPDRPLVYVAGPYSSDPEGNTLKTLAVADRLHKSGLVTCMVPHLTHYWDVNLPGKPYEFWLEYDIAGLRRCDALFRIPGHSSGADDEIKDAIVNDQPVFYNEHRLLEWAAEWLKPGGGRSDHITFADYVKGV